MIVIPVPRTGPRLDRPKGVPASRVCSTRIRGGRPTRQTGSPTGHAVPCRANGVLGVDPDPIPWNNRGSRRPGFYFQPGRLGSRTPSPGLEAASMGADRGQGHWVRGDCSSSSWRWADSLVEVPQCRPVYFTSQNPPLVQRRCVCLDRVPGLLCHCLLPPPRPDMAPLDHVESPPTDLPNVSSNSSWTSTPSQLFPLDRYIETPQRHEEIAFALSAVPPHAHEASALGPSDTAQPLHWPAKPKPHVECPSITNGTPLHRYLADVSQAHEQLALALEHPSHRTQATPPPAISSPVPSISLSQGGADEDDTNLVIDAGTTRTRSRERRRCVVAELRPRVYIIMRKRRSKLSPEKGREKMTRRE
ncbi:hypothetical protein BT67DRAFT_440809 [Trichocladium antarcticum]|uniref:Uncharacterized protein n=1 Tax=Trichocladium antarcticum TaxID=1450529 RepID=A0AAN6UNC1_9PEZI|nr:hypothetical protein BT67DRAFT_440809 [Trichocladium antarcticum]